MTSRTQILLCVSLILVVLGWWSAESTSSKAASPENVQEAPAPVETDMHEFMEYVFQPTFMRLQPAMQNAPADNQGWKIIKSESLVLAEGGNLLLIRPSEEDTAEWVEHSTQVRKFGGELYRAGHDKDFSKARKSYESMIENCNACHQQYAHGEHILKP